MSANVEFHRQSAAGRVCVVCGTELQGGEGADNEFRDGGTISTARAEKLVINTI